MALRLQAVSRRSRRQGGGCRRRLPYRGAERRKLATELGEVRKQMPMARQVLQHVLRVLQPSASGFCLATSENRRPHVEFATL